MSNRNHLLILMVAANPLLALDLAVCPGRSGSLDSMTDSAFRQEIGRIAARSGVETRFLACSNQVPSLIRLRVDEAGPDEAPDALGAAVRRDGRIAPELRVFVGPIARLVGTRLPYLLGLAMARVAAHELGHYLRQDDSHDHDGEIMSAVLTGPKLIAAHDFRIRLAPGRSD